MVEEDVRVSELWPRHMCMSMMGFSLSLGLRDRGRWVYAGIDGVSTDGNGWVEGFRVEVLEMDGIIWSGHRIWHCCSLAKKT